jgi:hypothetical protein
MLCSAPGDASQATEDFTFHVFYGFDDVDRCYEGLVKVSGVPDQQPTGEVYRAASVATLGEGMSMGTRSTRTGPLSHQASHVHSSIKHTPKLPACGVLTVEYPCLPGTRSTRRPVGSPGRMDNIERMSECPKAPLKSAGREHRSSHRAPRRAIETLLVIDIDRQ